MITKQAIREREIKPVCSVSIGVESDAVRIPQSAHVLRHFFELSCLGIELVENIDHATTIVGEVVHVRDEDPVVRTLGHEPDAFQTLSGNTDPVAFRKAEFKRLSIGECNSMWDEESK